MAFLIGFLLLNQLYILTDHHNFEISGSFSRQIKLLKVLILVNFHCFMNEKNYSEANLSVLE